MMALSTLVLVTLLFNSAFEAAPCKSGEVWDNFQMICIPTTNGKNAAPIPSKKKKLTKKDCLPDEVWVQISQACVSFLTSSAPVKTNQPVAYTVASIVPSSESNEAFVTTDLFQSTPKPSSGTSNQNQSPVPSNSPPVPQPNSPTPATPPANLQPSQKPSSQPNPPQTPQPPSQPSDLTPVIQNILKQTAANDSQSKAPPSTNIIIIYNSSGVAISQGMGAAVALSNSSNAGVGVGGAALSLSLFGGSSPPSQQAAQPSSTLPSNNPAGPTIMYVVDKSSVSISSDTGAAVGKTNGDLAGIGMGGSATSIADDWFPT